VFDTESEQGSTPRQASKTIDGLGPSEIQVRNILDTAMDGIISMDAAQKIVLFNAAAEAIFGWSAEQVLGKSIDILIPERFHGRHHTDVKHFGQEKTKNRRMATQRTVKALRASGEEFPIEASISQTTINDEKVYTVILRDVTEAVRYRQQIEQQSQMLDQVSDAVSVVNREDRITYWNQAATRLFGWTADEALGKKACELLFRGDARVLSEVVRETDARRSWNGELVKVTRSGEPVIVEHRRTVLQDETGQVKGHLCIDIDITARKKRERAAHRSQRLESIGTLAGGIAHDLNNVLTPILMGAKLLASGRIFGDRQGLLETMVASAQRGADLVTQLLAFAGGIRGERAPVCIDEIVNETCKLMEHTLPKSIRIATSSTADCPPVLGDSTELSQVLMNLCINARDAMPDGGTLTIKSEAVCLDDNAKQLNPDAHPGRYVLLKVSDTGIGMSADILDRIFDPFFTTKEVGKGTGLGLATVQGIVKSHSGFINVYSEPKNGTKFMIYLPVEERFGPDTGKVEEGVEAATRKSGRGYTVLLVDDELFILKMTATALEASGFKVITARDGAEAISIYSRHRDEIAVVLLDMMMPGLDGLQTLEQLQRINPEVAVVACSGLRTQQREKEALERGAKYFLPKPYSESQLLEVLSNILRTTAIDPSSD
jgi:two-component system cell cycle sensor histidine kinase/response regulator CckA